MKREFIVAKSKSLAYKVAPWATVIAVVPGGFIAFDNYADYIVWLKSKRTPS